MSDGLNELIQRLSQSSRNSNNQELSERFKRVNTYLLGLDEIRIFIADSVNYGHQSSSVNILRNLIRLGCTAKFTLVLYARNITILIKA